MKFRKCFRDVATLIAITAIVFIIIALAASNEKYNLDREYNKEFKSLKDSYMNEWNSYVEILKDIEVENGNEEAIAVNESIENIFPAIQRGDIAAMIEGEERIGKAKEEFVRDVLKLEITETDLKEQIINATALEDIDSQGLQKINSKLTEYAEIYHESYQEKYNKVGKVAESLVEVHKQRYQQQKERRDKYNDSLRGKIINRLIG